MLLEEADVRHYPTEFSNSLGKLKKLLKQWEQFTWHTWKNQTNKTFQMTTIRLLRKQCETNISPNFKSNQIHITLTQLFP